MRTETAKQTTKRWVCAVACDGTSLLLKLGGGPTVQVPLFEPVEQEERGVGERLPVKILGAGALELGLQGGEVAAQPVAVGQPG
eukprot:657753-Pleurochrysis_carterae.AAC.2